MPYLEPKMTLRFSLHYQLTLSNGRTPHPIRVITRCATWFGASKNGKTRDAIWMSRRQFVTA
jgi:hypothetical protein